MIKFLAGAFAALGLMLYASTMDARGLGTDRGPSSAGKALVVMYWTTTCGNCKNMIPILNRVVNSGKANVLGVVMDASPRSAAVQRIIYKYGPNFTLNGRYPVKTVIPGYPTIVIIKAGKVVKVFYGFTAYNTIQAYL